MLFSLLNLLSGSAVTFHWAVIKSGWVLDIQWLFGDFILDNDFSLGFLRKRFLWQKISSYLWCQFFDHYLLKFTFRSQVILWPLLFICKSPPFPFLWDCYAVLISVSFIWVPHILYILSSCHIEVCAVSIISFHIFPWLVSRAKIAVWLIGLENIHESTFLNHQIIPRCC